MVVMMLPLHQPDKQFNPLNDTNNTTTCAMQVSVICGLGQPLRSEQGIPNYVT
jgi:hypothetical protein